MAVTFPGETSDYRSARNSLLKAEIALRAQVKRVAELRRTLPDGGSITTDYVFTSSDGQPTKLSDLFTKGHAISGGLSR